MRIIKWGCLLAFLSICLCGCSARELEDRTFPQAMEITLRGDTLYGGFGNDIVSGESLAQICENYQERLDDYLDLGHIKAIVLGKALLADREKMQSVLLELEQMPIISRNSLVFTYEYQAGESYLKKLDTGEKSAGQYLCDMYRNNPYQAKNRAVTLSELLISI